MVKLKDLLNEGKYTVYFDMGSPGLMSKTVDAKNEKEAEKKVASGLHGKFKIKKVNILSYTKKNHFFGHKCIFFSASSISYFLGSQSIVR